MNLGFHPVNTSVYQNFPQGPRPVSQFSRFSRSGGSFRPASSMTPMHTSVQSSFPASPLSQVHSHPTFAGLTENYVVPYQSSYPGFPEHHVLSQATSCLYGSSSAPPSAYCADNSASSSYQPWYFDSGATNHITNNLQNLNLS